jgi:hypothetical protein
MTREGRRPSHKNNPPPRSCHTSIKSQGPRFDQHGLIGAMSARGSWPCKDAEPSKLRRKAFLRKPALEARGAYSTAAPRHLRSRFSVLREILGFHTAGVIRDRNGMLALGPLFPRQPTIGASRRNGASCQSGEPPVRAQTIVADAQVYRQQRRHGLYNDCCPCKPAAARE